MGNKIVSRNLKHQSCQYYLQSEVVQAFQLSIFPHFQRPSVRFLCFSKARIDLEITEIAPV